ncbi:prepilin-type N-terminal cleavage/methylation domain-containing protein [Inquilinus sp. NPDC058860]|uniref:prepilin-type N-terminal cleavage/methylation domain-containing protein n=1 Tax=Inquilinus sp. NPDC058860 TaxID=3346652 RepID=UPI0036ADCAC1
MTRQRGFTLVETLVTLVVVGMVLAVIFAGLRLFMDRGDRNDAVSHRSGGYIAAYDLLSREAASAVRFDVAGGDGPTMAFAGRSDELSLMVEEPPEPSGPQLAMVWLTLEARGEGTRLRFRRAPYRSGDPVPDPARATEDVIVGQFPGPARFDFAGGSSQTGGAAAWEPSWTAAFPPALIRLSISSSSSDGWPEIVVPFRVDAEPACLSGSGEGRSGRNGCSLPRSP